MFIEFLFKFFLTGDKGKMSDITIYKFRFDLKKNLIQSFLKLYFYRFKDNQVNFINYLPRWRVVSLKTVVH